MYILDIVNNNIDWIMLKIRRPDDFHIHLRDNEILRTVLPYTSCYFGRAIVMPNIIPPITTIEKAIAYRKRILAAIPTGHRFIPLMTCYLVNYLDKQTLIDGYNKGIFFAAKLYPMNVTNNSAYGISNIKAIYPIFSAMEEIGMPLLIHGESNMVDIDVFSREAYFIKHNIKSIRHNFPLLKIVLEHISTKESVDYVLNGDHCLAATITPHHLMFNYNHMFVDRMQPHLYCLPVLKGRIHQQALRTAITSGCERIFLGTDSAPHTKQYKESSNVYPGIFNSPAALQIYATVFEEMKALHYFESFCSLNGAKFYNLDVNEGYIKLYRKNNKLPESIQVMNNNIASYEELIPLLAGKNLNWIITNDNNN